MSTKNLADANTQKQQNKKKNWLEDESSGDSDNDEEFGLERTENSVVP